MNQVQVTGVVSLDSGQYGLLLEWLQGLQWVELALMGMVLVLTLLVVFYIGYSVTRK